MCLLVPVDAWLSRKRARPDRLQSIFKLGEAKNCQAGNLLQIHFDGGKTQAKCDGKSTKSLTTSKSEQKLYQSVIPYIPTAHDFRVISLRN